MGRGGAGGAGERQEAKALPPQVSTPGVVAEGGMASGGEGLLEASQEARLRKDESREEDTEEMITRFICGAGQQHTSHQRLN